MKPLQVKPATSADQPPPPPLLLLVVLLPALPPAPLLVAVPSARRRLNVCTRVSAVLGTKKPCVER